MFEVHHQSAFASSDETALAAPSEAGTNRPKCLAFGLSARRSESLLGAATRAGWDTECCSDDRAIRHHLVLARPQMVVVDLEDESGQSPPQLKTLVERLARQSEAMLVICGNRANVLEEIWARQLGAWLYLPGVASESDLESLFQEAQTIVARRRRGRAMQAYFPPSAVQA